MINIFLYIIFFLFSLGQIGRISLLGQQIDFYLYEILLFCSLSVFLIKYKFQPFILSFRKFKIVFIFLLFLFLSYLAGLKGFDNLENSVSFLYFLRLFFYFVYFFYLSYHVLKAKDAKKNILRGIMVFILITIITSLLQYFFYSDLRNLVYLEWDPHLYRMFGVFFDTYAASAVYSLIFLFALFNFKGLTQKITLVNFFIFTLLTYARGAYISFIATVSLFLFQRQSYKRLFYLFLAFIAAVFIIPKPFGEGVNLKRIYSIETRFSDYKIAYSMWLKKPIFGIGYNRIRYEKKHQGSLNNLKADLTHAGASYHSSFLIIFVTGGIAGLFLFSGLLLNLSKISISAGSYIVFLSVFSMFDNVILHPFILFLLLTFLAFENPYSSLE